MGQYKVPAELMSLSLYRLDENLCGKWAEVLPVWQQTYKGIDILSEVRKAHTWEVCNPDRRKTKRVAFLNNWLCRANENQHRLAQQQQGVKALKPYIPPEGSQKAVSCQRCQDKGIIPTQTVTRWGDKVDAYAKCPDCQEKLKLARYGR